MVRENNSTIVFEVRLWNPKRFSDMTISRKDKTNPYNGMLRVKKYTQTIPFHTPGQLLSLIESNYFKIVKQKEVKE